jgi:hypothetical protein
MDDAPRHAASGRFQRKNHKSVVEEWLNKDPRNPELMTIAQEEIAKIRAGQ